MKKVLWVLLAALMVLGAKNALADAVIAAQSQDARLVDNIDVIFLGYANKVLEHKNIVDFRLNAPGGAVPGGAGTGEWGGAIDGKHDDIGVIGVYVNRPFTPNIYNGSPATWVPTGGSAAWAATNGVLTAAVAGAPARTGGELGAVLTPANKIDIFWGKDSGNSNLGIHINYADNMPQAQNSTPTDSQSPAVPLTTTTNSSQVLGADLGLGFKSDSGPFNEIDIHGGFSMGGFANTSVSTNAAGAPINNDKVSDNGIYTITIGALGNHDLDKDTSLRVFLDAVINQLNTKASVKTDFDQNGNFNNVAGDADYENTVSNSGLGVALGLGCNHKVNDGAAVFSTGLILGYGSTTAKATESNSVGAAAAVNTDFAVDQIDTTAINVSWRGSVDTKVASWLNVRAGMSKNIFNRSTSKNTNNRVTAAPTGTTATTTITGDTTTTGVSFNTGFGVHWENWVVNTTVTAASVEGYLGYPQPGGGVLFFTGNWIAVAEADLGYAF